MNSTRLEAKHMKRVVSATILILIATLGVRAQTAVESAEITQLLREFLTGAARNDVAMHDRFWAADLIYTGSAGRRRGKAEIMKDVRSAPAPKPEDPKITYSAEDIRIRQYGNMAVLAFRLVSTTEKDGKSVTANFLNTGTLRKRNRKWSVVSWQATRVPRAEEMARRELALAEAAFHKAVLDSDIKTLEALTDESFVWTPSKGEPLTRQQVLDFLKSGQLKYTKLETKDVTIQLYGDTGVVRGVSLRQHSSIPGTGGQGDASPITTLYTLTFVFRELGWKVVAMHSSRP